MENELYKRLAKLFRGNTRSHGLYDPNTRKASTVKGIALSDEQFRQHVEGVMGIGVVPIMDDDRCWFGAIDIDAHGDAPDIDLIDLEAAVREKDLPLVVCRSKSGGAHLYIFGSEPLPAKLLRSTLSKWCDRIGYPGVEIFPKQDKLVVDSDNVRQYGNWINLAWFDAFSPDCGRYAVEGGRRVTLEHFLDIAESKRVSAAMLVERGADEHAEAPPCIQKIIANGVGHGQRNEAMFNLCVYLKQAFPETWKDKAYDLNARVFEEPLPHLEARKSIASAGRRDYRYRCKEEPCRSNCKSHLCVTRRFGISTEEKHEMEMGEHPEFGPLEKVSTEPPRWMLYVDGVKVTMSTNDMMDYRSVRVAVADRLTRLLPPMKNEKWQVILHGLMKTAIEHDAPIEASASGAVIAKLVEFLARGDMERDGNDKRDLENLLHGVPVVAKDEDGRKVVYFRAQDFTDFLKRTKSEDIKGPNLWVTMREAGIGHTRIRATKDCQLSVWVAPYTMVNRSGFSEPRVESEI